MIVYGIYCAVTLESSVTLETVVCVPQDLGGCVGNDVKVWFMCGVTM